MIMLPGFLIGMAAGSVAVAWLYEHARSSIWIVVLAHAFLNMGSAVKGAEGLVAAAVSAFVIVCAVVILRRE